MPAQPYVARLPDGRYFAVELPAGSADTDPLTGEVILQPPAIRLLDRLRALLSPMPANTTPGRLRILRDALGLGRDELAAMLHLEAAELEGWESGKSKPTLEQLTALEQIRQRSVRAGVLLPEHVFAS
ncbi:MAG TPA: helix-turn-helix transcriptional regulator [Gemmataceae bacterium]|jgi:DNA-binding transcriptional regulator YiaG|nr:helix-turn-helix transcriptional regulator [Gemmataceae bacterium]